LSPYVDEAKKRLTAMEMPIPEVDQVAYNRMKYELENRDKANIADHAFGMFKRGPDMRAAAKSGSPAMTALRPTIPVTVPVPAEAGGFQGDVTVQQVGENSALDTQPDARAGGAPAAGGAAATAPASPEGTPTQPEAGAAPTADAKPEAQPAANAKKNGKKEKQPKPKKVDNKKK
jgi:outer membrane protein assembly factor BamD